MKVDKRIISSKLAIQTAFITLYQDLPMEKISVKAICLEAHVNRSTFYAHYENPYDLLEKIEEEVILAINQRLEGQFGSIIERASHTPIATIIDYISANKPLFLALLRPNTETSFQRKIIGIVKQQNLEILAHYYYTDAPKDYIFEFMAAGAVSLLKQWLYDPTDYTTQSLSQLILDLTMHGQSYYFKD